MFLLPLILACGDEFEKNEQDIYPLDTAEEQDIDDTGVDTDVEDTDTEDTNTDPNDTGEPEDTVVDSDGDGFPEDEDCDDNDPTYNPDAPDNENDGQDQNCDGVPDDNYVDPNTTDDDGDGFSEDEGDCDDNDISLNPSDSDGDGFSSCDADCNDFDDTFAPDLFDDECDGVDQNCNGIADDGFLDQYEPNETWTPLDTNAVNYLGQLDTDDDLIEITNYHGHALDVDKFVFYNDDGFWTTFHFIIDVWDVPPTLDLAIDLEWYDENGVSQGIVDSATSNGPGTDLQIDYSGSSGTDDTGYYVLTVTGIGADCTTPYQIRFEEVF